MLLLNMNFETQIYMYVSFTTFKWKLFDQNAHVMLLTETNYSAFHLTLQVERLGYTNCVLRTCVLI